MLINLYLYKFIMVQGNYAVQLLKQEVLHFPTLKTVLQVEQVLMNAGKPLSREAVKRALGGKVMHQTLNVILRYLEGSGKIYLSEKGITWIFNPSRRLDAAIKKGVEH